MHEGWKRREADLLAEIKKYQDQLEKTWSEHDPAILRMSAEIASLKRELDIKEMMCKEHERTILETVKMREAYQEIAYRHYEWRFQRDPELLDAWDGKTKAGDEVDAEAKRIAEGKS